MACLVLLLTKNGINKTIVKVHKYISLSLWHLHSNHADVKLNCAQFCICVMLCIGYLHCRTLFLRTNTLTQMSRHVLTLSDTSVVSIHIVIVHDISESKINRFRTRVSCLNSFKNEKKKYIN